MISSRALGTFEECNFISVKDHLQLIPGAALNSVTESISKSPWAGGGHGTSDGPLFNPCWGQEQVVQASQLALMQAETMLWISQTSGMTNNKKKDVSGSKDVKVLYVVLLVAHKMLHLLPCVRELKHQNISRRKSIFRGWPGLRTAFWARIFNLSSARITTTDARRVKRHEN